MSPASNEYVTSRTRREWLRVALTASGGILTSRLGSTGEAAAEGQIMTVLGPISPAGFGRALVHEHVLVDFVGADLIRPEAYRPDDAYQAILPHLERLAASGCRGFVECTPAYLGRVPRLLVRLARATGLHIVTNTGYYGAGKDRFVPRHAHEEPVEAIAGRWTREWEAGIEGTGIRPGFIKTGVDPAPLSVIDRKLVHAAALTHLRTGLTIASHTADTRGALEQLDLLRQAGVAPDAFIWVHAQNDWDLDARVEAARKGTWIEIDNVSPTSVEACVERANHLKRAGVLDRLLVSHDAGWYDPSVPGGGRFRPFDTIEGAFLPALRRSGWTAEDTRRLIVANPAAAFAVRVRPGRGDRYTGAHFS
jgi:phosphotriesterase-related protein